MSAPPLSVARATAVALAAGAALLSAFVALGWRSFAAAWRGLDFNGALFEDFLGPYWQTASALAAGQCTPADGYLYPAFGAWLLAPITALGDGAASLACAGLLLGAIGSCKLLLGRHTACDACQYFTDGRVRLRVRPPFLDDWWRQLRKSELGRRNHRVGGDSSRRSAAHTLDRRAPLSLSFGFAPMWGVHAA